MYTRQCHTPGDIIFNFKHDATPKYSPLNPRNPTQSDTATISQPTNLLAQLSYLIKHLMMAEFYQNMQRELNILLHSLNYKELSFGIQPCVVRLSQMTFQRNFRLHLQGRRLSQARNQHDEVNKQALQVF